MPKLTQRQRSQRSKEAILAAARRQFAANGYEATTIRSVAAEAQIHPSMVMRYYGDKLNLFIAATDVVLSVPDLTAVQVGQRGRVVIEHFFKLWEGAAAESLLRVLLINAAANEASADQVRRILAAQLVQMVTAVSPDAETAPQRAWLTATQILGLALCRYILQVPEVADLDKRTIIEAVGPVIQHYLTAPLTSSIAVHETPKLRQRITATKTRAGRR